MNATIELLRRRRSLPPQGMTGPGPSVEEIETLLTIASRVPDHGKLAPWRFLVFEGAARDRAGAIAAAILRGDDPALSEARAAGGANAFLARATGHRGHFARRASCQNSRMGTGSIRRRGMHESGDRAPMRWVMSPRG